MNALPGLSERLEDLWYAHHPLTLLLLPFSLLYTALAIARRGVFTSGLLRPLPLPVPVIVVGNITLGGTGKTPLVIWLHKFLKSRGFHPGVISRGYRGQARHWPQQVRADSDPLTVGDEPVVIARHCGGPIAVGPDRQACAEALLRHHRCDVIISDDGLQHYRLKRDLEIAVIDGIRRYGNGFCLPAGPLREPVSRLKDIDLLVTHGIAGCGEFAMSYQPQSLHPVHESTAGTAPAPKPGQEVHALAGTGHPEIFFSMLRTQGFRVHRHPFPDHHWFSRQDIHFEDGLPVIMTEKDAVKCARFAGPEHWYLPIEANMPDVFAHRVLALLKRSHHGQAPA